MNNLDMAKKVILTEAQFREYMRLKLREEKEKNKIVNNKK